MAQLAIQIERDKPALVRLVVTIPVRQNMPHLTCAALVNCRAMGVAVNHQAGAGQLEQLLNCRAIDIHNLGTFAALLFTAALPHAFD